MASEKKAAQKSSTRQPPATTVEQRENQLIAMAYDYAEEQFRKGTATSQLATHFLKMGTVREDLERERLRQDNLLSEEKILTLKASRNSEADQAKIIEAMRTYSGRGDDD